MKNQAAQIIPYLAFHGNCEEALHTYMAAFGGEILYLSRWSENTCQEPEQIGKVMHAECMLGATRMAAGDSFENQNNALSLKLMLHLSSTEDALHAISLLSQNGSILSPLQPHPAPDDAGCGSIVRDGFGITWIVTCPNPMKQ